MLERSAEADAVGEEFERGAVYAGRSVELAVKSVHRFSGFDKGFEADAD
jgi:hypothetical protein